MLMARMQQTKQGMVWFYYFCLFIVATGCPSERHPPPPLQRRLVVTGDSARIQVETTESSAWFFNVLGVIPPGSLTCSVYSTFTRDLGLHARCIAPSHETSVYMLGV